MVDLNQLSTAVGTGLWEIRNCSFPAFTGLTGGLPNRSKPATLSNRACHQKERASASSPKTVAPASPLHFAHDGRLSASVLGDQEMGRKRRLRIVVRARLNPAVSFSPWLPTDRRELNSIAEVCVYPAAFL